MYWLCFKKALLCSLKETTKSLHVCTPSVQRLCKKQIFDAKLSFEGRPRKLTSVVKQSRVSSLTLWSPWMFLETRCFYWTFANLDPMVGSLSCNMYFCHIWMQKTCMLWGVLVHTTTKFGVIFLKS